MFWGEVHRKWWKGGLVRRCDKLFTYKVKGGRVGWCVDLERGRNQGKVHQSDELFTW